MAFRLPPASREDVGATPRRKMTPNRALRIFEANKGICVTCGRAIDGVREDYFIEHPRSLGMGGSDKDEDLGPAHWACKALKDAADAKHLAKARDVKKLHLGIARSKAPIPQRPCVPKAKSDKLPIPPRRANALYAPKGDRSCPPTISARRWTSSRR